MFKKRLLKLLKENRVKNTELADFLQVSKSAVIKWLSGDAEPRPDTLRLIANFFNVSVGYLINDENPNSIYETVVVKTEIYPLIVYSNSEPEPIKGIRWIPIYETITSAIPGINDIANENIIGWHTAPEYIAESFNNSNTRPFSIKITGRSMLPTIKPGDYLTVRPFPFIDPENDKIYAIKIKDNITDTYGIVIKRVQIDTSRKIFIMRSDNPEIPVYIEEDLNATIIGRVTNIWHRI